MKVHISNNYEEASLWVATQIKNKILSHEKNNPHKPFVLGLPTGSSIEETYKYLVEFHKRSELSFKNIITFNMDEYVGLPPHHEQSYAFFMHQNLFNFIDIDKKNINLLDGLTHNIDEHVEQYEEKIQSVGGIDLFVGGIGENAHLAFNEPFTSFHQTTHEVFLTPNTILANARFFEGDTNKVPTKAISVGIKTVTNAHAIILVVSGRRKAHAIQKVVEGGVNQMYPASALQLHHDVTLACDEEAVENLMVKNYKYFKEIS